VSDAPRLTTIMGVARAVVAAVGPRAGARALVDEFGWDATFQAVALLRGEHANEVFGAVWVASLVDDVDAQLGVDRGPALDAQRPGRVRP
jgi:hypothetical protein